MAEPSQKAESPRESVDTLKQQAEAKKPKDTAREQAAIASKELAKELKSEEKTKTRGELEKEKKTAKPAAPKEKKGEKKREVLLERVYTVPLVDAYGKPAKKRANTAVKLLRGFVSRHMKAADQDVKLDNALNSVINARGATHPPKKVRVSASKDKTGVVLVALAK